MRALLLAGVVLAGLPAVTSRPVDRTPAHFQLTLTPTSDGYAASCTTGCSWKALTFTCADDCHAVIDEAGIDAPATTGHEGAAFAFTFHRKGRGWEAKRLTGTSWLSLGWSCGRLGACSAEVTETGVHGTGI